MIHACFALVNENMLNHLDFLAKKHALHINNIPPLSWVNITKWLFCGNLYSISSKPY